MRLNPAPIHVILFAAIALAACQPEVRELEDDFAFDGSCVSCHKGLSAASVHPVRRLAAS